jgi:hypothetical protein
VIIKTQRGFYTLTDHAEQEMDVEEITEYEIIRALENGHREDSKSSGRDIYIYRAISVVVDENDEIVTVYRV